jgi:hypothetical protein
VSWFVILNFNKLSLDEQLNLEGEINVNEASKVLQKMNNNKSPGSDGFSTEFFKFFWIDLKSFVVNSINFEYFNPVYNRFPKVEKF